MEANDKNDIRAFAVDAGTQRVLTEALAGRGAQVQRGDIGTAIKNPGRRVLAAADIC